MSRHSIALIALLVAIPVAAQQTSIPEELVYGLLGGRGSMSQTITVGQPPPGFPSDLKWPASARVLGGVESGRSSVVAIVALPGNVAAARPVVEQTLIAAGWMVRQPDSPQPASGFQRTSGFQSGGGPGMGGPPVFCKGPSQIIMSTQARTTEQTYVRLDYQPGDPRRPNACEPTTRSLFDEGPLPLLTIPEGSRQGSGGTSGGSNGREAYTQLETPATAKELVDHFSAQIRQAGWTAVGRNDTQGASTATFVLQKDGRNWHAVLVAMDFPGTLWREAILRVSTARE